MYDFKKIRKWLIIIPFFVQHIFVAPSIVSNLFLYNILSKNSINANLFDFLGPCCEEDACKGSDRFDQKDFESLSTENSCNNFLKNFIDKVKKPKNVSQDIIVCDNRIDRVDKKFSEAVCKENQDLQERPIVAFA